MDTYTISLQTLTAVVCGNEEKVIAASTPKPTVCPEKYEKIGDTCYHFALDFSRTWDEAREYCHPLGGDLAVIHDCTHFGALVRHIHMTSKLNRTFGRCPLGTDVRSTRPFCRRPICQEVPDLFSYWVGGTDRGDEGSWFWIDGLPMAMGVPFWGEVQGVPEPGGGTDQNCAQLNKADRYYIHDGQCDKHAYTICQYGVEEKQILDKYL
ncbi:hypothetical protein SK128_025634 [Halocaridina rubra]|uniref:C-type lectin domain-containing protein n=1 Tax=Halocaridina rubra TaxID=373956 RepID=A0AAN8XRX7_HALRR